jgi:hypothetical protein
VTAADESIRTPAADSLTTEHHRALRWVAVDPSSASREVVLSVRVTTDSRFGEWRL